MSPNLDPKLAKALRRECEKCPQPSHGDSGLCLHHKGKAAARQKHHRQRLADNGRCSAGCGRKVGKRRRTDGTTLPRECPTCAKKHRDRTAKARERVRNDQGACVTTPGADPGRRGHFKYESDSRDASWRASARFVGRDRRGAPSKEDRWRDAVADVEWAIAELTTAQEETMPELLTPRIVELGRIAKREAHAIVADQVLRVCRALEGVAEALCPGRVAEVRAEMGE